MKYLEWFEYGNIYYKILYIFYGIISVTCIKELPYVTSIFSILMVILSFIYFCIFFKKGYYFKMSKVRYLLVLFLVLQISSFFVSNNYIADFIRLVFNVIYFFIISISIDKNGNNSELEKIFRCCIYIIFPIVFLSLLTYWFKIKFVINSNIYGRLDEYEGANKILTGLTVNVNTLGILSALLIIFSIHLLISKKEKYISKLFLVFNIVIGGITLFHTAARGAMLTLVAYVFFITIFAIKNKIISMVITLVSAVSGFAFMEKLIKIKGIEKLSTGRSLLWSTAGKVIKENPIFGVGTTAFVDVVKSNSSVHLPGIEEGGLHNIFIQIATANGCIALIVFILFISIVVITGIRKIVFNTNKDNNKVNISLLSIIISFLVLNLVESGLMYIMSFIALIFWICIGAFINDIELEQ